MPQSSLLRPQPAGPMPHFHVGALLVGPQEVLCMAGYFTFRNATWALVALEGQNERMETPIGFNFLVVYVLEQETTFHKLFFGAN